MEIKIGFASQVYVLYIFFYKTSRKKIKFIVAILYSDYNVINLHPAGNLNFLFLPHSWSYKNNINPVYPKYKRPFSDLFADEIVLHISSDGIQITIFPSGFTGIMATKLKQHPSRHARCRAQRCVQSWIHDERKRQSEWSHARGNLLNVRDNRCRS